MATRRSPSGTVAKQALAKRKTKSTSAQSTASAVEEGVPPLADAYARHARIAIRAYALFEKRGCRPATTSKIGWRWNGTCWRKGDHDHAELSVWRPQAVADVRHPPASGSTAAVRSWRHAAIRLSRRSISDCVGWAKPRRWP
ncbi:MAG: DUF2934 domain-containing protein [Nitrospirae bacterium]|nr:DUF2934 domain-containing protein [Nitrospirota bacterium]